MKKLFFTVLLFLPLTCFAQKKETWWSRGREEQKAESAAKINGHTSIEMENKVYDLKYKSRKDAKIRKMDIKLA